MSSRVESGFYFSFSVLFNVCGEPHTVNHDFTRTEWTRGCEVLLVDPDPASAGQPGRQTGYTSFTVLCDMLYRETVCTRSGKQTFMSPLSNHAEAQKTLPRLLKVTQLAHGRSQRSSDSLLDSKAGFPASHWTKTWITWLTN